MARGRPKGKKESAAATAAKAERKHKVQGPGGGSEPGCGQKGTLTRQAADAVYNTRRHSQYLVSAVAVAFWNSSYRSATDKVRDVPPRQWSP